MGAGFKIGKQLQVKPLPGTKLVGSVIGADGSLPTPDAPEAGPSWANDEYSQWISKSLLTADGDLFYRSNGVVTRLPIGTATQVLTVGASGLPGWAAAGGGGGGTPIMEQIWSYLAGHNGDPIDTLITSGNYVVFIYLHGLGVNAWTSAANATHTVAVGKTLTHVGSWHPTVMNFDFNNRRARLQNITDGTTITGGGAVAYGIGPEYAGDLGTPSVISTAPAGKVVTAQLWNADGNKRAMGGIWICYEA